MTWYRPVKLEEALEILASNHVPSNHVSSSVSSSRAASDRVSSNRTSSGQPPSGQLTIISGGTDLFVSGIGIRRAATKRDWLDIHCLAELRQISETVRGLRIGAAVTAAEIWADPIFEAVPALQQAARVVGGWQIQNRATVGGNIANASPAADMVVPLIAYGAVADVRSTRGVRKIRVDQLVAGPGVTTLEADELIVSVTIPKAVLGTRQAFLRHDQREGTDISLVSAAVVLSRSGPSPEVPTARDGRYDVRVCVGAANPIPYRLENSNHRYEFVNGEIQQSDADGSNHRRGADALTQIARECAQAVRPITDVRATADYRRAMVEVFVRRALQQVLSDGCQGRPTLSHSTMKGDEDA